MTDLVGLRASELARCPRMAAYRGLGVTEDDRPADIDEYLARGRLFESYVCAQLEQKHGKANVVRQLEVPWPLGVGHADALIVPTRTLVEVVSTVSPSTSGLMWEMKVEQLRVYLRHCDLADTGVLMVIDPSRLRAVDTYRVVVTDEDRERIDAAVAAVSAALDGGDLPHRVCAVPGQARGRLCPFGSTCFADWAPPDATVNNDPAALAVATRLATLKTEEREKKAELKQIETARKDVEYELGEILDVGETTVGPFRVVRTHVQRQPVFQLKAAEAAGMVVPEEFFKPGASYDTWRIDLAKEPGPIDYGEEAPF